MKIKLSYKLFTAFLVASLMIVALLIGIMQFFVHRKFSDYVNRVEMEKLTDLTEALSAEYQRHQGWESLRRDPERWQRILRSNLARDDFDRMRPPPPAPPPFEENMETGQIQKKQGPRERGRHPPPPRDHRLKPDPGKLSLFDAQKHHVIGRWFSIEKYTVRKITADSRIIGWLGLRKRKRLSHPLDVGFLKEQIKAFYFIGCGILVLGTVVSFFLSKHLLMPIRQLRAGTRALISREFKTRIEVCSTDELGDLAADFNVMARTLEKYEQMRKQWLSDISHELRTPLSILRGEIEALQDGIREMNSESLESLHSEVIYLGKTIDELHQLSLADTETLSFKKEPVSPLHVLKDTLRRFRTRLIQREIAVQDNTEHEKNIILLGDADRLSQLFSNLLENTLRYTEIPGTLKIWQKLTDTKMSLFFQDSGPGVPEESAEHLFDRLYRVDKSRSRMLGGSGLGLSICKQIVENHGGKISAANMPSEGLRIEITFPLDLNKKTKATSSNDKPRYSHC
ncbi:ATP-binding protein [Desulfonema magnum]|uniref:histidine kinase n=1 Tax=Desulfonema magnum TaxID=45655 RepID=A0A975GLJ0_9BACT|nr:ATP-binding protein [Desulfonema magnum]QTA85635.1 Two component system histidine kinase, HAMP domain-containing [Desulfonema magnum]